MTYLSRSNYIFVKAIREFDCIAKRSLFMFAITFAGTLSIWLHTLVRTHARTGARIHTYRHILVLIISISIRSRAFVNNFTLRRTGEPCIMPRCAEAIRRSQAGFTLNVGLKDRNLGKLV